MLTDKALEDYKKWLSDYSEKHHNLKGWRDNDNYLDEVELPETLELCLYQQFFEDNGFYVNVNYRYSFNKRKVVFYPMMDDKHLGFECETRDEALKKTLRTTDALYNNRNNENTTKL